MMNRKRLEAKGRRYRRFFFVGFSWQATRFVTKSWRPPNMLGYPAEWGYKFVYIYIHIHTCIYIIIQYIYIYNININIYIQYNYIYIYSIIIYIYICLAMKGGKLQTSLEEKCRVSKLGHCGKPMGG